MTNNPKNPLAERLRAARKERMTQLELATQLSWPPSKISKLESGRQLPTAEDITAWAESTGTDEATALIWLSMLDQARAQHQQITEQLRAGQAAVQMGFQDLVTGNTHFRFYEKVYVPLFLQTPAYTQANLTDIKRRYQPGVDLDDPSARGDLDSAVSARQASASRLFDPGCQFEFILDEALLHTRRYGNDIWRDQLIRIAALADLSNVRLGILPTDRIYTVFNTNSFELYGDVVSIELSHAEIREIDDEVIQHYSTQMQHLWAEAVTGPEAIDLIDKARHAIPR
jgi:transcriptional regulator with XRE-family HTH domain